MKTLVIFLHGSGGTGPCLRERLMQNLDVFNSKSFLVMASERNIDIITPTSDVAPYAPAFGDRMNIWHNRSPNFLSLGRDDREYISEVNNSIRKISSIVQQEYSSYDKIFIGGFSMGGGLALHFLRKDSLDQFESTQCESSVSLKKLAGVFSCGSFLVSQSQIFTDLLKSDLPILMIHGKDDDTILPEWGRSTAAQLQECGLTNVQYREYRGEHRITEPMLRDVLEWITDIITSAGASPTNVAGHTRAQMQAEQPRNEPAFDTGLLCGGSMSDFHVSEGKSQANMPQANILQANESSSKITSTTTVTSLLTDQLSFTFHEIDHSSSGLSSKLYRLDYTMSEQSAARAAGRPVLASGGQFDVHLSPGGVYVEAHTSDPARLGQDIGKRLAVRISDDTPANPCPVS